MSATRASVPFQVVTAVTLDSGKVGSVEHKVSVSSVGAVACWIIGLTGAVINVFIEPDIGTIAAAFLSGAICLTVRGAIVRSATSTAQAFQLGREAERRQSEGSGLRRI